MSRDKFRPLIKAIADLPSDGHELGQILDLVKHLKFQIGADEKLQLLLRDLNKSAPGGIESLEFWFGNRRAVQVDNGFRSAFPFFMHGEEVISSYDCSTFDLQCDTREVDIPHTLVFNVPRSHELALSLKQLRAILEDDKHGEGKKLVSSGGYNLAFVLVNGQVCFLEITRMFGVWMVKLPSKSSQNTCWKAGVRILYNPQKPGA